jgi:hypothetical protein
LGSIHLLESDYAIRESQKAIAARSIAHPIIALTRASRFSASRGWPQWIQTGHFGSSDAGPGPVAWISFTLCLLRGQWQVLTFIEALRSGPKEPYRDVVPEEACH